MDEHKRPVWSVARGLGIFLGVATHLLFVWTVCRLFLFLQSGQPSHGRFSAWTDAGLAIQFAVPHSLLLWPPCRSRLRRWVPDAFYGLLFCAVTCVSLLILFRAWSASSGQLWLLQGWPRYLVQAGFCASWVALLYSLSLTGLGYQTGWTPWLYWLRRQPQPRRQFVIRGAYHWFRHPVYLSFLGLIWFTPHMTWDHLVLTAVWTVYIYVGSYLKDERLAHYVGPTYRQYQASVAGYPLPLGFGPWGRLAAGGHGLDPCSAREHRPTPTGPLRLRPTTRPADGHRAG